MTGMASRISIGQFRELSGMVIRCLPDDIDSTTAQGWIDNPESLRKALHEALVPDSTVATPSFTVTVDYSKTVEEMVEAGHYNWKNSEANSENFPVKLRDSGQVEVHLIHFDRYISSEDAIAEMDKTGYRPAELPELLAFGAEHPDEQRSYPIIALGSVWRHSNGDRHVPVLWSDGIERNLDLSWFEGVWKPCYRFLALRK